MVQLPDGRLAERHHVDNVILGDNLVVSPGIGIIRTVVQSLGVGILPDMRQQSRPVVDRKPPALPNLVRTIPRRIGFVPDLVQQVALENELVPTRFVRNQRGTSGQ